MRKLKGWDVAEEFSDLGVSGSKRLEERPEGRRLFDAVESGAVDVIIASKLDRFARSTIGGLLDMEALQEVGAGLVILDMGGETLDTTTSSGKLYATMMLAFAEFEGSRIAERMETGRKGKARQGLWSGGVPPLGYTTEPVEGGSRLVIDEDEAATVRRLFSLFVDENLTPAQVAKVLQAEGRTTKQGGQWRHVQVSKILARHIYGGGGIEKTHGGETFAIDAAAIVDPVTYRTAAALVSRRAARRDADRRGDADKPKDWRFGLAGRAFHEHGGATLTKLYGEHKKGLRRYRCSDPGACPGMGAFRRGSLVKSIEARRLESVILEAVLEMLTDTNRLVEYQASYDAAAVAEYGGEAAVHRMRAKLTDLQERISYEARAVILAETMAGRSESEARVEAERAVEALQIEVAETQAALMRAEDREAQRRQVTATIEDLLSMTVGVGSPDGVDLSEVLAKDERLGDTTMLGEVRSALRSEAREVYAAADKGDRSADLSADAVAWLKVLMERLDLEVIIETENPETWELKTVAHTIRTNASTANGTGPPRPHSTSLLGGQATRSSTRCSPTALRGRIAWSSRTGSRSGLLLQPFMDTREATSPVSPTGSTG